MASRDCWRRISCCGSWNISLNRGNSAHDKSFYLQEGDGQYS